MRVKSTQNLAKILKKNILNPGLVAPKSRSGGFWAALGCFLVTRDLPDASGTPSGRLESASWRRLGGPRRPKNFAKTAHDASKIPPRQLKIRFSAKKYGKDGPFEFGWHFPFDVSPILS